MDELILNRERNELLEAYSDFVLKHWESLDAGSYMKISGRPKLTFKEHLTEEMIAMNVPDLSKDEELITRIDEAADRLSLIQNKQQQ